MGGEQQRDYGKAEPHLFIDRTADGWITWLLA